MKKYFLCVLLFIASGCVEVSDVEKMKPGLAQKSRTDFQYELIDRGAMNQYSVRFQMPESSYLLKKTLLPTDKNSAQEFKIIGVEWTDPSEIISGQTYQYEIGHFEQADNTTSALENGFNLKSEKWVSDFKQTIEIPFDLILDDEHPVYYVDSEEKVSLLRKINKLVMMQNTHLYTLGHDLMINAKYLKSENAFIESFPEESNADYMKPGLSGGNLELKIAAVDINSNLTVFLRGQNGGQGQHAQNLSGRECVASLSGERGLRGGDSGNLKYSIPEHLHFSPQLQFGKGGRGGSSSKGTPCFQYNDMGSYPVPPIIAPDGPVGPNGTKGKICLIKNGKEYCQ